MLNDTQGQYKMFAFVEIEEKRKTNSTLKVKERPFAEASRD